MLFQQTFSIFKRFVDSNRHYCQSISNNLDFVLYPIDDNTLSKVRNHFQLHIDETILLVRDTGFWNQGDQGCVVSDWGVTVIPDNDKSDEIIQIAWESVEKVEYSGGCIYFFFSQNNRSDNCPVHISYFIKDTSNGNDGKWGRMLSRCFNDMAASQYGDTPEKIQDRMNKLYDEEKYDEAIKEAEKLCATSNDDDYLISGYYIKGCALFWKGQTFTWDNDNMSKEECDKKCEARTQYSKSAYDAFCEAQNYTDHPRLQYMKAMTKCYGGQFNDWDMARRLYIAAMLTDDADDKENATKGYREITDAILNKVNEFSTKEFAELIEEEESDELKQEFLEIAEQNKFTNLEPLQNRQFLLFAKNDNQIAGYYDPDDNIKWVFTLDQIPADIQIEGGMPEADVLYVAHPQKTYIYVPYEKSEEMFFMDKVQEFCYLCQCLGAEKISFKSVKGKKISEQDVSTHSLDIDGNVKVVKGSVNAKQNSNRTSNIDRHDETELTQVFSPSTAPYCPEDLAWLESDSAWKMLLKQRLEGNILSYKYRIKSSETINITQNKKREIKASFQNLMNKVNANYDSTHDYTFNQHEETEWEISVVFRDAKLIGKDSINVVAAISTDILSESETEYLNEYKEIIAGGEISDRDKRYLEKIKKSNGISDSRAKELEKMASVPSLSDEEQEYLNEYKEMIADGAISERDRRFLDKIKRTNGISDKRASELEKMA